MNIFKKLEQELSHKEIAESFIIPGDASKEQRDEGIDLLWAYRKKRSESQTTEEKCILQILQLKFMMEDYINANKYNEK